MAITRSFGGQTLLKPGAYSVSRVDNAQGIAVGENNTLMLIGEATNGNDGSQENSLTFTNIQNLVDYYVSGDIVDAALAAGRPSITPGISAPTNFIIYKTNVSPKQLWTFNAINAVGVGTAATTAIAYVTYPINASGATFVETFDLTIPAIAGAVLTNDEANAIFDNLNSTIGSSLSIQAVFDVDYVEGTSGSKGSFSLTAKKGGGQFADSGNGGLASVRFSNTASDAPVIGVNAIDTARVTAVDGFSGVGNTTASGNNFVAPIAGGSVGAGSAVSLTSAFVDAFNFDPNVIIPLWSNPATGIQAANSPNEGTNFLNITAPIAGAQLQSHLIERSSVTVRKEAQGFIGVRNADWRNSYNSNSVGLAGITSFLIQGVIQDVRIIDSLGALAWKGPHVMAAMMAGIRLGSSVGEPLTFKFLNANGVGHFINTSTGFPAAASTQFRPGFDFNEAILNGLTFSEIASGGNRIVVDNTRYEIDESFVFNRGSVIEAAQFVARTSRQLLERIFVGNKVSNGAALSLKNVLRNYLIQLNTDEIITSSSDAPFGFVEETFTVSINGNTASIQVEVKPVQGLDFIFIDFTLGNITQQA